MSLTREARSAMKALTTCQCKENIEAVLKLGRIFYDSREMASISALPPQRCMSMHEIANFHLVKYYYK